MLAKVFIATKSLLKNFFKTQIVNPEALTPDQLAAALEQAYSFFPALFAGGMAVGAVSVCLGASLTCLLLPVIIRAILRRQVFPWVRGYLDGYAKQGGVTVTHRKR